MALVLKDRVRETTISTGTGTITLAGATDGYQGFDVIGDGNTTYYAITSANDSWEVGLGTYTASGTTLSRDTILESSNSGSAITLSGVSIVFCTYPAEKAISYNADDNVEVVKSISFTPVTHQAHAEGNLYYDSDHNTLNYQNDISGIDFELGNNEYIRVYNDTGSTLLKGKPVTFSGVNAGIPTVVLCNGTSASTYQVDGLVTNDITNGSYGYITISGVIRGLDTSGLTAGQRTFVGLTDGSLTNTAPTYPNYPMCVGYTVTSSASDGEIVVIPQNHSVPNFRIINNAHIGNNLIVEGDLTVSGTQTTTSSNNIETGAPFVYLASGDTIGEANTTFTGSGLDNAYFTGHYSGTTSTTYYVKIDGTGTPDTFSWSKDNFSTTEATGVAITGSDQLLDNGISILFATTTGHTLNDVWSGAASPSNVDTGLWSNINTGTSGVGYTHIGIWFDVTDNKWKLTSEYDPEPTGTINTADASYSTGTLVADLEGNASTVTNGVYTTDIGTTVQAYDADTAKLDVVQTWSAKQVYNDGIIQVFGTDEDLRIYHSGTNSFIDDVGTGDLNIRGANVNIKTATGVSYFTGASNVATLYHTGNAKLATESTGVEVTGTLNATTDVTVNGASVATTGKAIAMAIVFG